MKFKNWLIKEEQILNEDFKTQREKFIKQGIGTDIVDGHHDTKEEAQKVVVEARKKFHGEFWRDK